MAAFTVWLERARAGDPDFDLSPEALERLFVDVYAKISKRLAWRFPGGERFGGDTGDDLSQEVLLWLLRVVRGEVPIPDRVVDSKTLCFLLCDKAAKRSYDRAHAKKAGLHGGSGVPSGGPGEPVTAQAMASVAKFGRGRAPTFDAADAEAIEAEVLDGAIGDLAALSHPNPVPTYCFRLKVFSDISRAQIAAGLDLPKSTVNSYLRRGEFCLARRNGASASALAEQFGAEADAWERKLADQGRRA